MRPPPGSMVWWRFRSGQNQYHFGYCTYLNDANLVRMGRWNGDSSGGCVVDSHAIDWKPYREHLR